MTITAPTPASIPPAVSMRGRPVGIAIGLTFTELWTAAAGATDPRLRVFPQHRLRTAARSRRQSFSSLHEDWLRIGAESETAWLVRRRRSPHKPGMDVHGHIHLVLPDPVERAACFRALARDTERVVRCFASADAWAESEPGAGGVLLFRWHQPGAVSGADLLARASARSDLVSLVAADRLDLAESRALLRAGARDLLPAPLDPRQVVAAVDALLAEWCILRRREALSRAAAERLAMLTPREHDILDAIASGLGNKAIARTLGLSPRTVEVHRANIMRRAGASNVAQLLQLRFTATAGEFANSLHNGASGGAAAAAVTPYPL